MSRAYRLSPPSQPSAPQIPAKLPAQLPQHPQQQRIYSPINYRPPLPGEPRKNVEYVAGYSPAPLNRVVRGPVQPQGPTVISNNPPLYPATISRGSTIINAPAGEVLQGNKTYLITTPSRPGAARVSPYRIQQSHNSVKKKRPVLPNPKKNLAVGQSIVWKKYEDVSDDLKMDSKDAISSLTNNYMAQSHGILDAYNIMSRAENRGAVQAHRQDLSLLKNRLERANKKHAEDVARILHQMKNLIGPAQSSSWNEMERVANDVEKPKRGVSFFGVDQNIQKREMLDLATISDPDLKGFSYTKAEDRALLAKKSREIYQSNQKSASYNSKANNNWKDASPYATPGKTGGASQSRPSVSPGKIFTFSMF